MSSSSTDAEVILADTTDTWLQDHQYFALLSYAPFARDKAGIAVYKEHPDEIYLSPRSGFLYLLDNPLAAGEFRRKVCKGALCWRAVDVTDTRDKLGLEFSLATALRRGRPTKSGVKTSYCMNIVKSAEHSVAICHLLIKKTEAYKGASGVTIRRKAEDGIEWLLRANCELQQTWAADAGYISWTDF
jgi:hypothetical protein